MGYLTTLSLARLCSIEWIGDRRMLIWKGLNGILARNLPGGSEGKHEKTQSVQPRFLRMLDITPLEFESSGPPLRRSLLYRIVGRFMLN
jgi:hypothetical protein